MFPPETRVLVVDDMGTIRKLVIKACRTRGLKDFTEAVDGAKAWQMINEAKPPFDLVISDWNMPVMTGLECLKKVRADPRFKNLPFLLVTAEAERSQVLEAVQAGVSNYVTKPFTGDGLIEKLKLVYDKHHKPKTP